MHDARYEVQTRYGVEIAVMQEMNWSYEDLLVTPMELIEEVIERMNARQRWERERRKRDEARTNKKR